MNARDKARLARIIKASVKASNDQYRALKDLAQFELEHWGFEHGDRNIDQIIDAVCGGCGISGGMSADEFIEEMNSAK